MIYYRKQEIRTLKQYITIEFTAQPILPIMEVSFIYLLFNIYVLFTLINPVQFPLHEPYFDLTPIKVTHTKIYYKYIRTNYLK